MCHELESSQNCDHVDSNSNLKRQSLRDLTLFLLKQPIQRWLMKFVRSLREAATLHRRVCGIHCVTFQKRADVTVLVTSNKQSLGENNDE